MSAAALLVCCATVAYSRGLHGPPPITIVADEAPVWVAFVPPRERWYRYWARPEPWNAVYRIPLAPGRPYQLLVAHEGDPARLRATVTDDYPFQPVFTRLALALRHLGTQRRGRRAIYGARLLIPADAAVPGIHVLLEWLPAARRERPPPVLLGMTDPLAGTIAGAWLESDWDVDSPLQQEQYRVPVLVPVPRVR